MKKLLVPVLAATMLCVGCSAAWVSTLENYVKIAGPILIQILDIVSLAKGDAPSPALVSKITADQASVTALVNSIATASEENLPSECAQFNVAVATFAGDLSSIEQLANIGGKTSAEVQAAMGIAQAAFAEVEAPLAACANAPSPAAAKRALSVAKVTSPSGIVSAFNAVVDKKHRVHLHSEFARVATFGVMK
jgi:hypothetical protein